MKNRPQSKTARPLLGALLAASLLMQSGITQAATTPLSVSNTPLFVTTATLMPNIVLTLDDSGSMAWAYVPDSIGDNQPQTGYNSNTIDSTKRFKSSYVNGMYYNPAISYTPPPKFDNNVAPDLYPNSPFTAAYTNGFDTSRGTVNLSTNYTAVQSYDPDPSGLGQWFAGGANPFPILTVNYSYSCTVNFVNSGNNDRIDITGGCLGAFASPNISSGTVVTVTGSTRAGSYTVSSVASSNSVNVGGVWTNPQGSLNNQTVTLSWTITASNSNKPAYYYMFWSQLSAYPKPASCDNTTNDDDCYIPILVGSTSSSMVGPTLSPADLAAGNAAAKQQNFANWYSYYRTRNLAIKTGAMRALDSMDGNVRIAWQSLNKCTSFGTTCQGTDGVNRDSRIWRLNATDNRGVTHKQDLYEWLSRLPANGGTPMRNAAIRAGNYVTNTIKGGTDTLNVHSPFAQDPQITAGTFYSCRRNVSMLMTDGLWNSDTGAYGDADSTAVTVPSGPDNVANYPWTPGPPYRDAYPTYTNSNDLADIAFHFWSTDLQPGLSDNLSPIYKSLSGDLTARWINPRNDPATWQHLITYTVGLGLTSSLVAPYPVWGGNTYAGDYNNLVVGPPTGVAWPNTFGSDTSGNDHPARVADLWHAAIASRGQFFSAGNAQDIVNAFQAILTDVTAASASAAALAANSTSINTGAFLYQAKFDSTDWSGHLLALPVDGQGNVGAQVWDAATLLPSAAARNILTMVGSTGKTFLWGNLSGTQQTQLNTNPDTLLQDSPSRGQDRLNWLRGDQSLEEQFSSTNPNAIFRSRTQAVLGDIVNSDPVYSQKEDLGYSSLPASAAEGASYAAYVASKGARLPYLYVGANDGMLHAFNATPDIASNSGKEAFAYVPAAVYPNLSKLTDLNYGSAANPHQYYVDGAPSVGDAYINGAWSTVLVGGLNGGGKSVYALRLYKDGTPEDPASFSPSQVMWEYSDANDLGLTYSQPQIARLNNGQWAAIFGNGYNSTSGKAFLYVVNLADGTLIAKIPAGAATSNGLSTPVLYDANNDKIADFAYAGDLQGNMWKFDLTTFTVSYSGVPLFTARNASSQVQPITAQPKVGSHPNGGVLVYFGTGQYLATGDPSNTQVQSFYSIWDNGSVVATTDRSQLQAQTIVSQTSATTDLVTQADSSTPTVAFATRVTSSNSVDYAGGKRGWYMDLVPPSGPAGERVVSAALLKFDRVIFVTLIPSANDPCVPGGDSWIMELTALTGAVPATSVFDFNGDDKFDNFDQSSGGVISGVKSTQGITKTPAWLDKDNSGTVGFKELSGSSGGIMSLKNKGAPPPAAGLPSRVFWQQIM